ncbi:MAG: malonyl-[acyl-carrier protein] O-methyltransferase BioC [Desulfobulbus sp.]|nr:MAG: malonyl-[acyl-carrier protein] O-methyltransferase BioC [Desulfobulbus sp.]
MALPDKQTIRLRFAGAAATYDRQALVQQEVANRLLRLLASHPAPPPRRVLEIGCCTGILTAGLIRRFPGISALYVNDLVPEFAPLVAARVPAGTPLHFLAGDIETIDLPERLDLVVSSSTLHWLSDLPALLDRLHERLNQQGILCFSIYGTDNLRELREITGIGLDYHSLSELRQMVAARFTLLSCEEELLPLHLPDPLALLHHLRQTGVNALRKETWTRARLDEFSRKYMERFRSAHGVSLTYHPIYCLARKE